MGEIKLLHQSNMEKCAGVHLCVLVSAYEPKCKAGYRKTHRGRHKAGHSLM